MLGSEREGKQQSPSGAPLPHTHCVVIRVQVGHEHGGKAAQDPVHIISIVTTQLPECAFTTVQQQGPVGATERSKMCGAETKGLSQLRGLLSREEQQATVGRPGSPSLSCGFPGHLLQHEGCCNLRP